ncbi:methyl-accepting chemotaxis protein [Ureibacillus sp. GCM10028918]|uniref:methyl-accepting chemotaxis protein n=1 Tax=Ureibacillus sp. GCM10028918 TaxID=3273429 RepID=UPI003613C414
MKNLNKNGLMILLAGLTVFLSVGTHFVHRYLHIFDSYLVIKGMGVLTGELIFLQGLLLLTPILLFIICLLIYRINSVSEWLPWIIIMTMTFGSIAIIAGGDGLVEYHFSIFMVIAMIAFYNRIKLILTSTIIFMLHHVMGYFLFPELLCGTTDYHFPLLLIHIIYLVLTSGATILLTYSKQKKTKEYKEKVKMQQSTINEVLNRLNNSSKFVLDYVNELTSGSERLTITSQEIASSIQTISVGAEEQTTKLKLGVDAIHSVKTEIEQIKENTNRVNANARDTENQVKIGMEKIQKMFNQMRNITETVNKGNNMIENLEQNSKAIGDFVGTIASIADQTSLLALNASIEAARAGEQGNGFAVVAKEVRKLAQQSNKSAVEIQAVIHSIQEEIIHISETMGISLLEVKKGLEQIKETQKVFEAISNSTNEVGKQINDVTNASEALFGNSKRSNYLIDEASQITYATFSGVESILAATESQSSSLDALNHGSLSLRKLVNELNDMVDHIYAIYQREDNVIEK